MQPNPGDTTNALILSMINIMVNDPSAVNISSLSSSTPYSSSTAWMQALSYASLAFSLLAAFGAVLGKQWLNSYKAARWRPGGSLEERGKERQKKLNGIQRWKLQTILKAFLVLLQVSLFLFGLSLSANMWVRQATISILVMCITAFEVLFYVTTILVSLFSPDSPFQTAETALVVIICKKSLALVHTLFKALPFYYTFFRGLFYWLLKTPLITRSTVDSSVKVSAICWLLESSTNPDVVEPAAAMIPVVQWPEGVDASPIYARLRETLRTYGDRKELSVQCAKAMAHFFVESVKINPRFSWNGWMPRDTWGMKGRCIHDAFMVGRSAWDQWKMAKTDHDRQKPMADVRTALRTMVVYGLRGYLSLPNDGEVIQDGDLQWRHRDGRLPSCEEFDWLVDYLVDKLDNTTDNETQGDALLALSAMNGLGSDAKRTSYVNALIRCMVPISPARVRSAAIRSISDAREELLSIHGDSLPHGVDAQLFDQLLSALSTAVGPHDNGTTDYLKASSCCYSRLIFTLIKDDEWRQRLTRNGHVQRCIDLFPTSSEADICIAGICLHVDPSGNDPSFHEKFWELMIGAWRQLYCITVADKDFHDCLEILPALVAATKQNLSGPDHGVASSKLKLLATHVGCISQGLQTHVGLDANVLSTVQNFSHDLKRMVEHPNTY